MNATTKKESGIIVMSGMGGFLNPPTHPEHTQSVEYDLRKRPDNRSHSSLTSAVDAEWLDDATRAAARTVLASWRAPSIDSPEIQEWIRQVLGYFRNCYRNHAFPEPECWHAQHLHVIHEGELPPVDDHAGVHLIRKYYPDFVPTAEQFTQAKWGN